MDTLIV